jgi:hypothetical protein
VRAGGGGGGAGELGCDGRAPLGGEVGGEGGDCVGSYTYIYIYITLYIYIYNIKI